MFVGEIFTISQVFLLFFQKKKERKRKIIAAWLLCLHPFSATIRLECWQFFPSNKDLSQMREVQYRFGVIVMNEHVEL